MSEQEQFNLHNFINDIVDEVIDNVDDDTQYPQDVITEIVDGWVPVYNKGVIDFANSLHGGDFTEVWLTDSDTTPMSDCDNVIRFLQIKIFELLYNKDCDNVKIKELLNR